MKFALMAALTAAATIPAAAQAQTAPAAAATEAAPAAPAGPAAPAAKFDLDTPVEQLVADAQAKAVLDADLPGVSTHPSYDMFKTMSLRQLQPYSQGVITDEIMTKIAGDLAALK